MSFTPQKNWSYRFPWKTSSECSTIFNTSLQNFTEFHRENAREFTVLCPLFQIIKISKKTAVFLWLCVVYTSLHPQRAYQLKIVGSTHKVAKKRTSLVNKGFIIWDKTPKHDKYSSRDKAHIPSGQNSSILMIMRFSSSCPLASDLLYSCEELPTFFHIEIVGAVFTQYS